jgi:regulatory protein
MSQPRVRILACKAYRGKVRVETDTQGVFLLPVETVMQHGLRAEAELPLTRWLTLVAEAERQDCWAKLLVLLGQRAHAEAELRRKLAQRKFSRPAIATTLAKAHELGLLDDRRFAEQLAEEKLRTARLSQRALAADMRQRGLAVEVVRETFEALADRFTPEAALAQALTVARQRRHHWARETDPRQRRLKIARFLAGRGFASSICFDAARQLLAEQGAPAGDDDDPPE